MKLFKSIKCRSYRDIATEPSWKTGGKRRLYAESLEERKLLAVSVIDFEALEHVDNLVADHGSQYEEDGFVLINTGTTTTSSGSFASFGTQEPRYLGSTSLFNNTINGWTELFSASAGETFTLLSIDLSELTTNVGGSIRFVGRLPDGGFVSHRFTIDGVFGPESFSFPDTFSGLSSAYWVQQSPLHQFDNIVVAKEGGPPQAVDDAYQMLEDDVLVVDAAQGALANDSSDAEALLATLVSGATNGRLTLNNDGSFVYTPQKDFFGVDSFTYQISDEYGATDTARVEISVLPVNDRPVIISFGSDHETPENSAADGRVAIFGMFTDADPADIGTREK